MGQLLIPLSVRCLLTFMMNREIVSWSDPTRRMSFIYAKGEFLVGVRSKHLGLWAKPVCDQEKVYYLP